MRRRRWFWGLALTALLLMQAPVGLAAPRDEASATPGAVRIDINSADEQALQRVPGIGEALAKRIVDFRKQHGPFERVEDLMKVRGIGERSFEKMRPFITVGKGK